MCICVHPGYAAESYELDAIDYLLKPVTYKRFARSIIKFLKHHMQTAPGIPHSYFKINGKLVKVVHSDIVFAQSVKDYIILKTLQDKYMIHMTMKYLVELLPADTFSRVHRSFLVNHLHIKAIGNDLIETGDTKIPIGKNYKQIVAKLKSG